MTWNSPVSGQKSEVKGGGSCPSLGSFTSTNYLQTTRLFPRVEDAPSSGYRVRPPVSTRSLSPVLCHPPLGTERHRCQDLSFGRSGEGSTHRNPLSEAERLVPNRRIRYFDPIVLEVSRHASGRMSASTGPEPGPSVATRPVQGRELLDCLPPSFMNLFVFCLPEHFFYAT